MSDPYWYEKEIEELRTEIERLQREIAEVARLRAALEEIARSGAPFDAKGTHSKRVQDIAIRALKDKTP